VKFLPVRCRKGGLGEEGGKTLGRGEREGNRERGVSPECFFLPRSGAPAQRRPCEISKKRPRERRARSSGKGEDSFLFVKEEGGKARRKYSLN